MKFDFLKMTYKELLLEHPEVDEFDSGRKCAAFIEGNNLDSYSNESTILVYYDCINPDTPLMVVERIDDVDTPTYSITMEEFIKSLQELHEDYMFHCDISADGRYRDLVAVKRNIYEAICGKDNCTNNCSDA